MANTDRIVRFIVFVEETFSCKKMFIESICDSSKLLELEDNIRKVKLKLSTPDYRDMDPEVAIRDFDFKERRENYEKAYEPVVCRQPWWSLHQDYIINSEQYIVNNNNIRGYRGYLPLKVRGIVWIHFGYTIVMQPVQLIFPLFFSLAIIQIVHFVMNLHTLSRTRTFYFTRHGQLEYNLLGKIKIGGDMLDWHPQVQNTHDDWHNLQKNKLLCKMV